MTFINDVGSTCKGSVGTLLTLNYVVGEAVVELSKEIGHTAINLLIGIAQAIHVLLEELGTILIIRMPWPFTGPKMFLAGPNYLCQTKNLFTYCGSHKNVVPDKKMICIQ